MVLDSIKAVIIVSMLLYKSTTISSSRRVFLIKKNKIASLLDVNSSCFKWKHEWKWPEFASKQCKKIKMFLFFHKPKLRKLKIGFEP